MATPELLSATYMPNAKPEYWRWFGDLQRKTSTGRNAAAMMDACAEQLAGQFSPEFKACQVEVGTQVCDYCRGLKIVRNHIR